MGVARQANGRVGRKVPAASHPLRQHRACARRSRCLASDPSDGGSPARGLGL